MRLGPTSGSDVDTGAQKLLDAELRHEGGTLVPASSVALFASASPGRVTPEALRTSLRRRGLLDLSIFAACFGAALTLSSLFDHGALGWRSLAYVALLMLPAVILHRLPPQRCPACSTALEASTQPDSVDGLFVSVTLCPHCEVGIE